VALNKLTWTLQTFNIANLTDYSKNPRSLSKDQFAHLKTSLDKFGMIDKPIINLDAAHTVIGGHQRLHVLKADGVKSVECWIPDRELDAKEVEELNIRLNKNMGNWDFDILANEWSMEDLLEWGFDEKELGINTLDDGKEYDESIADGIKVCKCPTCGNEHATK
jgi:ParB-like chromosome segregation protein Spo0J